MSGSGSSSAAMRAPRALSIMGSLALGRSTSCSSLHSALSLFMHSWTALVSRVVRTLLITPTASIRTSNSLSSSMLMTICMASSLPFKISSRKERMAAARMPLWTLARSSSRTSNEACVIAYWILSTAASCTKGFSSSRRMHSAATTCECVFPMHAGRRACTARHRTFASGSFRLSMRAVVTSCLTCFADRDRASTARPRKNLSRSLSFSTITDTIRSVEPPCFAMAMRLFMAICRIIGSSLSSRSSSASNPVEGNDVNGRRMSAMLNAVGCRSAGVVQGLIRP
mmetsp:Transcript_54588/g.88477  ORF Transcript_54588/g.88477 Transcript_54588/m.88477 type:complete len:284 (+) Transcript_54588:574-1425(+)